MALLGSYNELCGYKNIDSRIPSALPQLESRTPIRRVYVIRKGQYYH